MNLLSSQIEKRLPGLIKLQSDQNRKELAMVVQI
jgi:hypothetical protein